MIGYIIGVILISIIVSIITEQLLIRRMRLTDGVEINKGVCSLKPGYGLLNSSNVTNAPVQNIGEYSNNN